MTEAMFTIDVLGGMDDIAAEDWNRCACPEITDGRPINPFTTHEFLKALEDSGSVGPQTGWVPRHLVASADSKIVAVMPLYAKGHSQGEYVFDHNWAHAWERAGGEYYPKLTCAVPFTPATGRRLLTAPDAPEGADLALIEGMSRLAEANKLSSAHITFCTKDEWDRGGDVGLLQRQDQQFHWENNNYADFNDFLSSLASRKRKQVRRERAGAVENGIEIVHLTGDDIELEHWDAFWEFYQDTGMRKWGRPYLTREFFNLAQERLREHMLLILCRHQGRWVAGALNVIGRDTLFGRYWGCTEHHPFLHFECCYYQAIDAALALGLKRVEAGAQGSHKLARGYLPTPTYSLHYIPDPGFRAAIDDYLGRERAAVDEEIEFLLTRQPFKKEQQGGSSDKGE
ncbi:MAG: GNAT family N-acetyltransferase [Pikeienuella sp.]